MAESIFASIILAIISLVIIWPIVSIPVWISPKILTSGGARFGRAMLVPAAGPIVYALVLIISTSLLSIAIGNCQSDALTALNNLPFCFLMIYTP